MSGASGDVTIQLTIDMTREPTGAATSSSGAMCMPSGGFAEPITMPVKRELLNRATTPCDMISETSVTDEERGCPDDLNSELGGDVISISDVLSVTSDSFVKQVAIDGERRLRDSGWEPMTIHIKRELLDSEISSDDEISETLASVVKQVTIDEENGHWDTVTPCGNATHDLSGDFPDPMTIDMKCEHLDSEISSDDEISDTSGSVVKQVTTDEERGLRYSVTSSRNAKYDLSGDFSEPTTIHVKRELLDRATSPCGETYEMSGGVTQPSVGPSYVLTHNTTSPSAAMQCGDLKRKPSDSVTFQSSDVINLNTEDVVPPGWPANETCKSFSAAIRQPAGKPYGSVALRSSTGQPYNSGKATRISTTSVRPSGNAIFKLSIAATPNLCSDATRDRVSGAIREPSYDATRPSTGDMTCPPEVDAIHEHHGSVKLEPSDNSPCTSSNGVTKQPSISVLREVSSGVTPKPGGKIRNPLGGETNKPLKRGDTAHDASSGTICKPSDETTCPPIGVVACPPEVHSIHGRSVSVKLELSDDSPSKPPGRLKRKFPGGETSELLRSVTRDAAHDASNGAICKPSDETTSTPIVLACQTQVHAIHGRSVSVKLEPSDESPSKPSSGLKRKFPGGETSKPLRSVTGDAAYDAFSSTICKPSDETPIGNVACPLEVHAIHGNNVKLEPSDNWPSKPSHGLTRKFLGYETRRILRSETRKLRGLINETTNKTPAGETSSVMIRKNSVGAESKPLGVATQLDETSQVLDASMIPSDNATQSGDVTSEAHANVTRNTSDDALRKLSCDTQKLSSAAIQHRKEGMIRKLPTTATGKTSVGMTHEHPIDATTKHSAGTASLVTTTSELSGSATFKLSMDVISNLTSGIASDVSRGTISESSDEMNCPPVGDVVCPPEVEVRQEQCISVKLEPLDDSQCKSSDGVTIKAHGGKKKKTNRKKRKPSRAMTRKSLPIRDVACPPEVEVIQEHHASVKLEPLDDSPCKSSDGVAKISSISMPRKLSSGVTHEAHGHKKKKTNRKKRKPSRALTRKSPESETNRTLGSETDETTNKIAAGEISSGTRGKHSAESKLLGVATQLDETSQVGDSSIIPSDNATLKLSGDVTSEPPADLTRNVRVTRKKTKKKSVNRKPSAGVTRKPPVAGNVPRKSSRKRSRVATRDPPATTRTLRSRKARKLRSRIVLPALARVTRTSARTCSAQESTPDDVGSARTRVSPRPRSDSRGSSSDKSVSPNRDIPHSVTFARDPPLLESNINCAMQCVIS